MVSNQTCGHFWCEQEVLEFCWPRYGDRQLQVPKTKSFFRGSGATERFKIQEIFLLWVLFHDWRIPDNHYVLSSAYSVDSILLASWEANISKVPANTFGRICCYLKMNSRKKTGDIPACYVSLLEGKEKNFLQLHQRNKHNEFPRFIVSHYKGFPIEGGMSLFPT